jgi:hypothetical protein
MAGVKRSVSCRELFKQFNILPIASEILLPLVSFIVDSINSDIHSINTRHTHGLHMPHANFTSSHKGVHYAVIELFSTLSSNVKSLNPDIISV